MNKKLQICGLLAIFGLAAISCQTKELDMPEAGNSPVFYARMEQSDSQDSRVYVNDELRLRWHADDRISIFNKNTGSQQYKFDGETGANEGTFSKVSDSVSQTGNALPAIYAVYPYNEETSIGDDGELSVVFPDTQTYAENSFAPGANPMVSVTEDNTLLFKNLGGYLILKLYGDGVTISKICLRGNNGEKLAGKAVITASMDGVPSLVMSDEATEDLTLTCPDPVTIGTTQDNCSEFWFVLPPTTFTEGFTVKMTDSIGRVFVLNTSKTIVISRNNLSRMSAMETDSFSWDDCLVPPDNEIWYTSTDGNILDLHIIDYTVSGVDMSGVDASLEYNTYEYGKGVMHFDGPISRVDHLFAVGGNDMNRLSAIAFPRSVKSIGTNPFSGNLFGSAANLKSALIPEGVTTMGLVFYYCPNLKELRIPDSLESTSAIAAGCKNLTELHGKGASKDGRVYTNNGSLIAFAPKGLTDYVLENIKSIEQYVFADCRELKNIALPERLESIAPFSFFRAGIECITLPNSLLTIGANAFEDTNLKKVNIPFSVTSIGENAFRTNAMEEFTGKYSSDNHLLLIVDNEIIGIAYAGIKNETRFEFPAGVISIPSNCLMGMSNLEEIIVNEGITRIGTYAFGECSSLKRITIPNSPNVSFGDGILARCPDLQEIYRDESQTDPRFLIGYNQMSNGAFPDEYQYHWHENTLIATALKGVKELVLDINIQGIGNKAISGKPELEVVDIKSSITSILSSAFEGCINLRRVTLPPTLLTIENNAFDDTNVDSIFIQSPKPPKLLWDVFPKTTTLIVPLQSLDVYKQEWEDYSSQIVGMETDYYISSDYSSDGNVIPLRESSIGSGIPIVIMGDGFSDRQISAGDYHHSLERAMTMLFSEEPFKSMEDYFDVYDVQVVSGSEGYEHSGQSLNTWFGDGTAVGGNDRVVIKYALKAITESKLNNALIIVLMNDDSYAGTCYMYDPPFGDYGLGLSIAYVPLNSDTDIFKGLVSHEAGGHGFAKLADEYAYEYMGAITENEKASINAQATYGWWKNVDFNNDPSQVKWSQFIYDNRYANENIGCYEGGLTYWTGVWRPTENSIMRDNTGGFNAPSRYAIWYRINKLAYGESWNGSYEDFVEYDAANRTPAAAAHRKAQRNLVEKRLPPLTPPVVVGHSWREELNKDK